MTSPKLITRRRALITGVSSLGGLALAGCSDELPPTYGNLLRVGDVLTYKAHRLLLPARTLAKEYARSEITSIAAIGTTDPGDARQELFTAEYGEDYARLRSGGFAEWRLAVEGSVARPEQLFARRAEAPPIAHAGHEARVRGRVVRDRRMDRRAAAHRARGVGHEPERALRAVLLVTTSSRTASTCSTRCTRRRSWRTG